MAKRSGECGPESSQRMRTGNVHCVPPASSVGCLIPHDARPGRHSLGDAAAERPAHPWCGARGWYRLNLRLETGS